MKFKKNKKKLFLFSILILIISLLVYSLYKTYAIENSNQIIFNVNNSENITLAPGESKILLYQVNNNNNGVLQYGIIHNNIQNISVTYFNGKGDYPSGIIRKNEIKNILLNITNNNLSANSSFNLKTLYGYEKGGDISGIIPQNYKLVKDSAFNNIILYDSNGGSQLNNSRQVVVSSNVSLISEIPTKKGFEFLGWSTDKDSAVAQYISGQNIVVRSNMNLYAVWRSIDYENYFSYTGKYNYHKYPSGDFRIWFLTSGYLIFDRTLNIDAFLVGGGGGGQPASNISYDGGYGGGGGKTKTVSNIAIKPNLKYEISIGQGGVESDGEGTSAFGNWVSGGGYGKGAAGGIVNSNKKDGVNGSDGVCAFNYSSCQAYDIYGSSGGGGAGGTCPGAPGNVYPGFGGVGGAGAGNGFGDRAEGPHDGLDNRGGGGGGSVCSHKFAGGSGVVIIRNHKVNS